MAASRTLCWAALLAAVAASSPEATSAAFPDASAAAPTAATGEMPVGEAAEPIAAAVELPVEEAAALPDESAAAPAPAAEELPVGEVAELPAASSEIGEVESEAASEAAAALEQAKQDLASLDAAAAVNLRGASSWGHGWGHGILGETCCMCSMHVGYNTVVYAAEDYSHFFGGHNAFWHCQHECEIQCHIRGGHQFGCFDEQHLLAFERQYGHRAGFQILHDGHFGNLC